MINLFQKYNSASLETYELFRPWLPIVASLFALFHIAHYFINILTGVSEPVILRVLAVTLTVTFALCAVFERTRLSVTLKRTFLLALTLVGPVFLFGAWLNELSSTKPNLVTLIRSQYEFAAAFGLLILASASITVATALTLVLCCLLFLIMAPISDFHTEILELSWVTVLSGYLLASLAIVVAVRRRFESSRSKSEAIAAVGSSIAHELRTPLLSIKTAANVIDEVSDSTSTDRSWNQSIGQKPISDNRSQAATKLIKSEAEAAMTLIDIFLVNSSWGVKNQVIGNSSRFSVQAAAREAIERFPYRSERERAAIELVDGEDFIAHGPKLFFVHVLFNLFKNAFEEFGNAQMLQIRVKTEVENQSGLVRITDNGKGIEPYLTKKIFEPFYSQSTAQGTGIGLPFCKYAIEEAFQGQIQCISSIGEGTEFTITIPQ